MKNTISKDSKINKTYALNKEDIAGIDRLSKYFKLNLSATISKLRKIGEQWIEDGGEVEKNDNEWQKKFEKKLDQVGKDVADNWCFLYGYVGRELNEIKKELWAQAGAITTIEECDLTEIKATLEEHKNLLNELLITKKQLSQIKSILFEDSKDWDKPIVKKDSEDKFNIPDES